MIRIAAVVGVIRAIGMMGIIGVVGVVGFEGDFAAGLGFDSDIFVQFTCTKNRVLRNSWTGDPRKEYGDTFTEFP